MADAESHADEDRMRREEAEIRNQAESLIFQTEKFLEESGDKVPADAKANVDEPLAELKTAIAGDDMSAIKAAVEKVATASQALGAALYANSQNEAGEAQAAGDDDVVDAEIVDENEKV
jgi:molecular chaperone DnaK